VGVRSWRKREDACVTPIDTPIAYLERIRSFAAGWFEYPLGRGRVLGQLRSRSDRPSDKLTAAVRTLEMEPGLCAFAAERAFERADVSAARLWWKIRIAAFATGSKFEHRILVWCRTRCWVVIGNSIASLLPGAVLRPPQLLCSGNGGTSFRRSALATAVCASACRRTRSRTSRCPAGRDESIGTSLDRSSRHD
jgi:hypothetical protein